MNLSQQFSKYDKTLEKQVPTYSGLLGLTISGHRTVNVENRSGFVYVRLRDNLSEVVQAMNTKVSPVYDFPVLIQRKGNRWIVVGRDDQRYETWGTNAPFLPAHGDQHSFNRDGGGGGDTVFVYPDQFMPLLVYPSGTYGAGNLLIAPYLLQRTSDYVYVGNTGTGNLLIYKPTTADAIIGLVYLNKTTGNPGVLIASGTPISATITGTAGITPYIPFVSSDQEPLYAFRLVSGTTALGWSNLYNTRQLVGRGSSSTGSSGGGISGITVWDEGVPQGTGTVFNFVGANVDVSVSGTVARVFVTGSAGSSLPSFITGSIPFSGADGILTENNPYLRWENTLRGLRIGQNFSQFNYADTHPIAVVGNNENEAAGFFGYMYGTGTLGSPSFFLNGYRSRGTFLDPTPVKAGDALLTLLGRGYEGGGSWPTAARVRLYADNDFVTGSVRGSRIDLDVIPSGSATLRTQLAIYGDSVNQPTGSTYNIGGVPHTHAYSSLSGTPTTDGWTSGTGTWSYSSADAPVFVMSIPNADAALLGAGDRITLTQTTAKFFIVVAKGGADSASEGYTTVTIYGGTDYTLANAAITSPKYSHAKSPLGFPMARDKWTVKVTDTTLRTLAIPTQNVWYNNGSITISIPIGCWEVDYQSMAQAQKDTSTAQIASVYTTLSTANNSESDKEFSSAIFKVDAATAAAIQALGSTGRSKTLTLTSKTSYYLNQKTDQTNCANMYFRGDVATIVIRAICAYL